MGGKRVDQRDRESDHDYVDDVGTGYWEIPPEIDVRAYDRQTAEQEARVDRFITDLFWTVHKQDQAVERPTAEV